MFGEYNAMSKGTVSARLRVDLSAGVSVGPGKVALLEGIARSGSLSAAARELGMSYRRAWLLVHSVNEAFREPVVHFVTGGKEGGGAQLTAFGETLIERYRGLELATGMLAREAFRDIATQARPSGPRAAAATPGRVRRPLHQRS